MSESFYNPENIEAYITNKMSAGEKAFFEHELAKDPLLHNEIDLQKDIVEALKSNRKAQLKNRLNNIQIDNTVNYTGLKVAASVLFAGLISFGGYNLITSNKQSNIAVNNTSTVITNPEKTTTANNKSKEEVVITENEKENNSKSTQSNIQGTVISKNKTGNTTTYTRTTKTIITTQTTVESDKLPDFNTPDVKDRHDEGDAIRTDNNINMPKGEVGNTSGQASLDNLIVDVVKDKNHNLFYQYYNNKLFLYGDFDSKPYEILELNTVKDKQLYLYFEGKYYSLKQNQIDMTALTVIKDKGTFSKLELIRNK
jgi:hypothetical protein